MKNQVVVTVAASLEVNERVSHVVTGKATTRGKGIATGALLRRHEL